MEVELTDNLSMSSSGAASSGRSNCTCLRHKRGDTRTVTSLDMNCSDRKHFIQVVR